MPSITRTATHDLGLVEAERRVAAFFHEAAGRFDVVSERRSEGFAFELVTQGVRVSGTVAVTPTELRLRAKLPLIAMPFVGWTTRILNMALEERAGAPSAQPAEATAPDASDPVLLFVHIPKAAGTTLKSYLFAQCRSGRPSEAAPEPGDLYQEGVYYAPFGFFRTEETLVPDYALPYLRDESLRAVLGHISYGVHELVPRPTRYVTMLRHPVDRVLSLYSFLRADEHTSLREFLAAKVYRELDNDQTRRIAGVNPPFGECTASHLEQAKVHLATDFVLAGVSERFAESVLLLRRAMGWTEQFAYHVRNVTPSRPLAADLAEDERDMILAMNRWDLELYEAAVERLDARVAELGADFAEELRAYQRQIRP